METTEFRTLYASPSGKPYPEDILVSAIRMTKESRPGWDLSSARPQAYGTGYLLSASDAHHMKAKTREIYAAADRISEEAEGIKTYTLSVALDARVDVKIKAKSLGEAKEMARAGCFDFDLANAELVGASPVNISDSDGNLLEDF